MAPKTVSVVGFKNSGKTRVVEALVTELSDRGYRVGTLKHTGDDVLLDSPGKDTSRHREAGSIATGILQENTSAIFMDQKLTLHQAAEKLGPLDYLIIEGFKNVDTHPRIIVPRTDEDMEKLVNGPVLAVMTLPSSDYTGNSIPYGESDKLADLVMEKAYPMLSGLDCGSCGYENCREMGEALLMDETELEKCVGFRDDGVLRVDGVMVPMNNFIQKAMQNVVLGFIKTLKGGGEARHVELSFEVMDDE